MTTRDWQLDGECAGVGEDFFDLHESHKPVLRSLCSECSVHDECLEFALTYPYQTEGMWAGTTPAQRKAMLGLEATG